MAKFLGLLTGTQERHFIEYCKNAYYIFFESSANMEISNEEFIDYLCQKEAVEEEPLRALVANLDKDESNSISFDEFVDFMIQTIYNDKDQV